MSSLTENTKYKDWIPEGFQISGAGTYSEK